MTSKEYIESGILEIYVMGMASHSEQEDVEMMAAVHPEIRQEIDAISEVLEKYALAHSPWLRRPDLNFSGSDEDNIFAKIIGYTPEMTTAIVWIKQDTPREIHHKERERFLIVEGSCDIFVGDTCTHLIPGDYFDIPLHEYHTVKVTSSVACVAILQRLAA